jgi:hypothetical protein
MTFLIADDHRLSRLGGEPRQTARNGCHWIAIGVKSQSAPPLAESWTKESFKNNFQLRSGSRQTSVAVVGTSQKSGDFRNEIILGRLLRPVKRAGPTPLARTPGR